jgi:hypothetical protein
MIKVMKGFEQGNLKGMGDAVREIIPGAVVDLDHE